MQFQYDTRVTNVLFDIQGGKKVATQDPLHPRGQGAETIDLMEDDLVFVTNGSCTENTIYGDDDHAPDGDAEMRKRRLLGAVEATSPRRIRPSAIRRSSAAIPPKTNWETRDRHHAGRPHSALHQKPSASVIPSPARVVTGGIVTVKDSNWLMSWTINRQPHFKAQPKDQLVVWVYGLYTDRARRLHQEAHAANAPAWKSRRNGCIIWVCRRIRSMTWPLSLRTVCPA